MTISDLIDYLSNRRKELGNIQVMHRMSDGAYRQIRPTVVKVFSQLDGKVLKVFNPTYDFKTEHGVIEVIEL